LLIRCDFWYGRSDLAAQAAKGCERVGQMAKWDSYIRGAESVSPERLLDQAVIAQVKAAVNFSNSVVPDQGARGAGPLEDLGPRENPTPPSGGSILVG